jgi:TolA-binding protein
MRKTGKNTKRASRIELTALVLFLQIMLIPLCQGQTAQPQGVTNLAYTIKNDNIDFPLILKFKAFRQPAISQEDLKIEKLVLRTNTVTNVIVSPNQADRTNEEKGKKGKKKSADEQTFAVGLSLFKNGLYSTAEEQFRSVLATAPDGKFADDAQILIARIRFQTNDLTGALAALDSVKKKTSEAAYYKTMFLVSRTNHVQAILTYEKLKSQDQKDEWFFKTAYAVRPAFTARNASVQFLSELEDLARTASRKVSKEYLYLALAELYDKDRSVRNLKKAADYYDLLVKTYPRSPEAAKAKQRSDYIRKDLLGIR